MYDPPTESEAVSVASCAVPGGHLNDTRVEMFAVLPAMVEGCLSRWTLFGIKQTDVVAGPLIPLQDGSASKRWEK